MKTKAFVVIALVFLLSGASLAGGYVALSIDQYQRFEPIERFMQYIPTLTLGWAGDGWGANASFNLYEDITGATSVHSVTPWTMESYREIGDYRVELNALMFVNVFDKTEPYDEIMVEVKGALVQRVGSATLQVEPAVRLYDTGDIDVGVGVGASWGMVTAGLNLLDTKDYYVLGRNRTIATAKIETLIANGNHVTIEINKVLGENGRNSVWWVYRFDFARLLEW